MMSTWLSLVRTCFPVSSKCDKIVDAVTRGSFDLSWVQPESGNTGAGVRVATGAASRVDRLLIGASGLDL